MATEKRLIDADELLTEVVKAQALEPNKAAAKIIMLITEAEKVDAVKVVHGRWLDSYIVKKLQYDRYPTVKCSVCGCYFCDVINNHHFMYHYCPNCGAKMDGDGNVDV